MSRALTLAGGAGMRLPRDEGDAAAGLGGARPGVAGRGAARQG